MGFCSLELAASELVALKHQEKSPHIFFFFSVEQLKCAGSMENKQIIAKLQGLAGNIFIHIISVVS